MSILQTKDDKKALVALEVTTLLRSAVSLSVDEHLIDFEVDDDFCE